MKRPVVIGLFLLLALTACHHKGPEPVEGPTQMDLASPELSAIDSLMWQRPDSALLCLIPWFDTCRDGVHTVSTDYNRHYANLLLAELLYKNDSAQANRAELQQAVAYFDSLVRPTPPTSLRAKRGNPRGPGGLKNTSPNPTDDLFFLSARAHYINGVGYYEQDSVVQACKEYIQSLEIMEERFGEKELVGKKAQFMALTHTRLASLFSDLYLHEQAIYFGKTALEYYQKYDASLWHLAWVLEEIGSQYDMMDNYDSAGYYYHRSLSLLPDTNNLIYRDIATRLAFLSYKTDGVTQISLNQLQVLIGQSETQKETLSRCAIIGEIYYHEGLYDSAWFYLKKVFQESQSINSKKQAAEWLVEICKFQGRQSEIMEYADFLIPFANRNENQGYLKSQLTEFYNEYKQKKQETLHQNNLKETLRKVGLTTLGVGIAFLVGLAVYVVINKKQIKAERKAHRMQQAALSGRLKRSNQEVRELKDQIKQLDDLAAKTEPAASFVEEPICHLIMERVNDGQFLSQMDCRIYKDYALSKEDVAALRETADRHFHHFTSRLAKAYPELTKVDLDYCCLYLLGLTDADIAALMQRAYNTVNERSGKLKRIFGCNNGISATLHAIANDKASI